MSGPSFSTSVLKREDRPIEDVDNRLTNQGWKRTGQIARGRIRYYEKSGFNITAMQGPAGTVLFPSGPVRGLVFGDNAVTFANSSMGFGQKDKANRSADDITSGKSHT